MVRAVSGKDKVTQFLHYGHKTVRLYLPGKDKVTTSVVQ
jgi:hypothetical protein